MDYLLVNEVGDHCCQGAALDFLLSSVGFLEGVEGPVDYEAHHVWQFCIDRRKKAYENVRVPRRGHLSLHQGFCKKTASS